MTSSTESAARLADAAISTLAPCLVAALDAAAFAVTVFTLDDSPVGSSIVYANTRTCASPGTRARSSGALVASPRRRASGRLARPRARRGADRRALLRADPEAPTRRGDLRRGGPDHAAARWRRRPHHPPRPLAARRHRAGSRRLPLPRGLAPERRARREHGPGRGRRGLRAGDADQPHRARPAREAEAQGERRIRAPRTKLQPSVRTERENRSSRARRAGP
jgi:hypothetical protein